MRIPTVSLLLSLTFLTGCLRGCEKGRNLEQAEQPPLAGGEESSGGAPSSSEAMSAESVSASSPLPSESSSATAEAPEFVADALQWAQDYRTVFAHIAKLQAIEEGRYALKAGELMPDIHKEYGKLHQDLRYVAIPAESGDLRLLMQKLDTQLGLIVQGLSEKPTAAELTAALEKRESLGPQVGDFYKRLQQARARQ